MYRWREKSVWVDPKEVAECDARIQVIIAQSINQSINQSKANKLLFILQINDCTEGIQSKPTISCWLDAIIIQMTDARTRVTQKLLPSLAVRRITTSQYDVTRNPDHEADQVKTNNN